MNGELPSDHEIINTLDRARVLFHRFGQMASQRVEEMSGRDMTPEDLEFVNNVSDLTEVFDDTVAGVRNVYDTLGQAVITYREQTESVVSGAETVDVAVETEHTESEEEPAVIEVVSELSEKPKIGDTRPAPKYIAPPIIEAPVRRKKERVNYEPCNIEEEKVENFFRDKEVARKEIIKIFTKSKIGPGKLSRYGMVRKILKGVGLETKVASATLQFIYYRLEQFETDLLIRDELPPAEEGKTHGRVYYYLKTAE